MHKKLWICGALLCTGLFYGQQKEIAVDTLEEVILIDSKFQLKRENSGKVVTKISAQELERSSGQSISEVINRVSGIEINGAHSTDGINLGYYIRGGRNRQVVILVDGVQLSDPSSISNDFDLRLLPLDQVASIEIIKGASSTLYGSGAATAVINITTKGPKDKNISLQLQSVLGTNQNTTDQEYQIAQFDNSVGLSGKLSKFDYQVNFSNRVSENMSAVRSEDDDEKFEDDPFSKYNVYARLGYTISDQLKFYFYGNYDNFNSAFDDAFMYTDSDNVLESEQFRTGSHWVATYKNGSFIFSDSYSELKLEIISDFPNKYDSKVYAFDSYNKYIFNKKWHTIIGLNGVFSSFNSYSIPFGETGFAQTVNDDVAQFDIVDPYVNLVFLSGKGLNINSGARLNIHSEYGTNWVYTINPSYNFKIRSGNLKALASYSTAYITPSLFQLYDSSYGNVNLNPEESATAEAGLEFTTERSRLSAVYFNRNTKNFIDFVTIDPETFAAEYQNITEEFNASGVELEVEYSLNEAFNFSANYTYTKAEDRFALRIPKNKINAAINYKLGKNSEISFNYQFTDDRTDNYFDNETFESVEVKLESYQIIDFTASHRVNEFVKIFGGISNITNERYEELYRFNTRGRNLRFGLALSF
tara:strand:+ start:221014 stop:222948 length:1935 start_codon:yes stop_codon:yes gene_type:complete